MGKRTPPPPGEQPPAPPGDDASLFRAAIGPVRELPPQPAPPRKPPPHALPRMAARDDAQALGEFRRALQADVLAFHSAPPAQGGNGAVLVLLKR